MFDELASGEGQFAGVTPGEAQADGEIVALPVAKLRQPLAKADNPGRRAEALRESADPDQPLRLGVGRRRDREDGPRSDEAEHRKTGTHPAGRCQERAGAREAVRDDGHSMDEAATAGRPSRGRP